MLALLARRFGDLDLADDGVQDALVEAARTWPSTGVPSNPPAWLLAVARRKMIDRQRRAASADRRLRAAAPELTADGEETGVRSELIADVEHDAAGGDEHLRLMLLCCHPALDADTQVALTLRLVGGLTTMEIAAGFLVPEATLAQRIVRAKRKIRDAGIPLSIPASLDDRVAVVLGVLYLVFNEGYLSRGDGGSVVRVDLIDEAVRLTRLLDNLLPERAEVEGLLALELYHRARLASREPSPGELVLLADQDRSQWDRGQIDEANGLLHRAMSRMAPGRFQLQAVIAGYHANATSAEATNWRAIAKAYDHLAAVDPSPVVALNRAVALGLAEGPDIGLAALDVITGLDRYHLWHAARGELLVRAGRERDAIGALSAALTLTANPAEQRHLRRRIDEVAPRTS